MDVKKMKIIIIILFITILFLWGTIFLTYLFGYNINNISFGDIFNSINTLFSGLAFLGIVFTILLQKKELLLQKKELNKAVEATKNQTKQFHKEMKNQTDQFSKQNTSMYKQNFESTFFHFLIFQRKATRNIILEGREGKDCFYLLYKEFSKKMKEYERSGNPKEIVNNAYLDFYNKYQFELGHYFRMLYNVIKFIDISDLTDKEKFLYSKFARAQLSEYELLIIFYNCLSDEGEKFKWLIEKYTLLKMITDNNLLDKEKHKILYNKKAFDKNEY